MFAFIVRAAVAARDDLIEDLTTERAFREQLERDVEELLESGLVAEMNEKQEEFEASCPFALYPATGGGGTWAGWQHFAIHQVRTEKQMFEAGHEGRMRIAASRLLSAFHVFLEREANCKPFIFQHSPRQKRNGTKVTASATHASLVMKTQQARCKKEHEETARVVAVHARMEEEYCIALKSSERERARLEEAVASLEETVEDERHAAAVRCKVICFSPGVLLEPLNIVPFIQPTAVNFQMAFEQAGYGR